MNLHRNDTRPYNQLVVISCEHCGEIKKEVL
jgi:hypothetical protein